MAEKYAEEDFEKIMEEEEVSDDDSTATTATSSETSESEHANDDDESIASMEDGDSDDDEPEKKIFKKSSEKNEYVEDANSDNDSDGDDDDDDEDDENYLQKFDENLKQNVISDFHPEMQQHNYDEIESLCVIVRDSGGTIIDPLHKTLPFLTKYEKARILGERAKQINAGAKPFVKVENTVIDGYLIALAELEQKMIPFIVKRPMPNGGCEYWRLRDLEIL
jgi:DNA-directed RNA polymerase I, II, and III subunit RPABC2